MVGDVVTKEAKARPVVLAEEEFGAFEPPPALPKTAQALAEKARDLVALRDAVTEAAAVGGTLWVSYLGSLFYLAVAAGAVTHKDLFLERPVKLPFLGIDLPLTAFFALGPALFLVLHTYVLLHFQLLAGKVGVFHRELEAQIAGEGANAEMRTNLRRQLPSNIFIQFLAGARDVRFGVTGWMLRAIAWISLVFGPVLLLVFFQLRFLPYHDEALTWWHRIAVAVDIGLLWWFWPKIAMATLAATLAATWRHRAVGLVVRGAAVLLLGLVWCVATFPGEWLHTALPTVRFIPSRVLVVLGTENGTEIVDENSISIGVIDRRYISLHKLWLDGAVDQVNRRPTSLFANVLVLPGVEAYDPAKFDEDKKFEAVRETVSLRGRHLEGAVLIDARLRKADLTGAFLQNAILDRADLRGALLECADRGGNRPPGDGCAQMQGAVLLWAQMQGASLVGAQMRGASLDEAQMQGALLRAPCVWRADARSAQFEGAWVRGARIAAATNQGRDFCDWSAEATEKLRAEIARMVPAGERRDEALRQLDRGLRPDPPAKHADEDAMAARWRALNDAAVDVASFVAARQQVGCAPDNAPYAARGLLRQMNAEEPEEWERALAGALLDPACAGAVGLDEVEKRWLARIRDFVPPAGAGAGR